LIFKNYEMRTKTKTFLVFLISIMITNYANSQTNFKWGKLFGSQKDEYVLNHLCDLNGNIYVAGKTTGVIENNNYGKNDGFLTKIDSSGNILWARQFGTPGEEDVQWCAMDNLGGIYLTGSTTGDLNGKNSGKEDVFVVKYNSEGKLLWAKQFGTDSTDIARSIYVNKKGDIYLTGDTRGKFGKSALGDNDFFIMKLDKDGNQIFTKQFGTFKDDSGYCITGGKGNDILICGITWGDLSGKNKGFIDSFTGQFTENGDLIKYNQFGGEGFDIAEVVKMDDDNNIYVGGSTSGNLGAPQAGEGDCFLLKLNENGEFIWKNQFGTSNHDGLRSISFNSTVSDNLLVSGILNLPPSNAFVRMYNKDGKMLWEKIFVGSSGKSVSLDNDGNIFHVGLTANNLFGNLIGKHNYYVVKLGLDKIYRKN
jgi:hypothetical protein